jgi:hypothetical protein
MSGLRGPRVRDGRRNDMQVTQIFCDRCKKSFKNTDPKDKHFEVVAVRIAIHGYAVKTIEPMVEWCRACCNSLGLLQPRVEDNTPAHRPVAIEDIVKEIVMNAVNKATGAA